MRKTACSLHVLLFLSLSFLARQALAVQPGVDIAAPRVAVTTALDTFMLSPANPAIEQGDYVEWQYTGSIGSHTTTSGPPCVANGLWNAPLSPTTRQFFFQFGTPATFPYFCSPHCGLGMTGQVTVTGLIDLALTDTAGLTALSWSGGGPTYRVFSSDNPGFNNAVVLASGATQTSFADPTQAPPGQALFYLVMNQF